MATMTPEQLALVRDTATKVTGTGEDLARCFSDRLLELRPSACPRFPDPHEPRAFVDEVLFLATAAQDLPVFVERARALGRRQQRSGVRTTDHPLLGAALLGAVEAVSGEDWTPAVADAWRCLFALVSETMLEGAAGGLFRPPPAAQASPRDRPAG
jgi:hemoglobin-like flavoprotein